MHIAADAAGMSEEAAAAIAGFIRGTLAQRERFSLVLSGGSTPAPVYRKLAADGSIPWERVLLFWGDERFVPHADARSNYRMAKESLLDAIPIPPGNVHPFPDGMKFPADSAATYGALLRRIFPGNPEFDLVLLGMGPDGHTASLFPGSRALNETSKMAVASKSPFEPRERMTLTIPALNSSRRIFFLVAGKEKAEILAAILNPSGSSLPAALVHGLEETAWFLDHAAAEALGRS